MDLTENQIAKIIVDKSFKVHRNLGPGLLESSYEKCLYHELRKTGLFVERQKEMPLVYDRIKLDIGYRVDMILNKKVIIEIKAVEKLTNVHIAQLLTYLKLSGCKLGILINFNSDLIKKGIKRIVNNL
jgi:GxxExxY protein